MIPAEFMLHAWNPDHSLQIGGDRLAFGTVGSAPNSADLDHGRRTGNRADYQNFLRLAQMFDSIHFVGGYPVEPIDIHASVRHLQASLDILTLTEGRVSKIWMVADELGALVHADAVAWK